MSKTVKSLTEMQHFTLFLILIKLLHGKSCKSLFSSLRMLVKVKVSYYMPGHILRAPGGIAPRILGNWNMMLW